jgi:hypothetical protein
MNMTTEYAVKYARFGWPVFRIRANSKIPLDRWVNGEPSERATTDVFEAERRWPRWSIDNIGIATGWPMMRGGFLTVLDLDTDEPGFAGRPDWAIETYEVHTPSGGLHLYYATAEPVKSGRIAPGVDVKSRGGMVVAPPSTINGSHYVAVIRRVAAIDHVLFSPAHVLSSSLDAELAQPLAERMSFRPEQHVGEGGRDTYLARYAGWWLNQADEDYTASIVEGKPATEPTEYDLAVELDYHNLMVCHPPLPERDVKRIARSIFAKHLRDSSGPAL